MLKKDPPPSYLTVKSPATINICDGPFMKYFKDNDFDLRQSEGMTKAPMWDREFERDSYQPPGPNRKSALGQDTASLCRPNHRLNLDEMPDAGRHLGLPEAWPRTVEGMEHRYDPEDFANMAVDDWIEQNVRYTKEEDRPSLPVPQWMPGTDNDRHVREYEKLNHIFKKELEIRTKALRDFHARAFHQDVIALQKCYEAFMTVSPDAPSKFYDDETAQAESKGVKQLYKHFQKMEKEMAASADQADRDIKQRKELTGFPWAEPLDQAFYQGEANLAERSSAWYDPSEESSSDESGPASPLYPGVSLAQFQAHMAATELDNGRANMRTPGDPDWMSWGIWR